jgi:hypothetical protein
MFNHSGTIVSIIDLPFDRISRVMEEFQRII